MRKETAYLTVDDRAHAESLSGVQEGAVVYNAELDAEMVFRCGRWVTFTGRREMGKVLSGYVFCLTGKMWETRERVEGAIRGAGGGVARTMGPRTILVQGAVSGARSGNKSKKQLDAERNGHMVIAHETLADLLHGRVSPAEMFGGGRKVPKGESLPVEPIDRDKQNRTVKQVFEDIEAIAFGK